MSLSETMHELEQLIPYTWRKQSDYDVVLEDLAKYVDSFKERFLDCARYDALMEGPKFKGYNHSSLDRLRREYEYDLFGRVRE